MTVRRKIGITVGDVAGIGPEIALKALSETNLQDRCDPVLYGPAEILNQIAKQLSMDVSVTSMDLPMELSANVEPGQFTAATGLASFQAVERAIEDAMAKRIDAIVTGPIQKEAWNLAGITFPGHTELLAARCGVDDFCMMLTSDEISCVLATIHIPLADVAKSLTSEKVQLAIRLGAEALRRRHGRPARVVVCGLNPHAGENGLFSHGEEDEQIVPAIEACRGAGIKIRGPVPPDTAFTPAMRATTEVYVCMYHDQGLIPLKALAFDHAVNVTLGLPIVRTSVDHGTAMDLAWQGKASHHSMVAAIEMACDLCQNHE